MQVVVLELVTVCASSSRKLTNTVSMAAVIQCLLKRQLILATWTQLFIRAYEKAGNGKQEMEMEINGNGNGNGKLKWKQLLHSSV